MGVDAILRRLERLREEIGHLRQLAALPEEAFFADFEHLAATERCLQVAIQCCLDVANHLLGLLGRPAAEDYAGLFTGLARAGVLDAPFAEQLRRMAGFRNILVHEYLRVREDLVRRFLVEQVDDLVRFGDLALKALPKDGGDETGPSAEA